MFHWSITEYQWILSCWRIRLSDKNQRDFKLYDPRKTQHFHFSYQCCVLWSTVVSILYQAHLSLVEGFSWLSSSEIFLSSLSLPRRILGLSSLDMKHCSMCKGLSQVIIGSIFFLEQEFIFKIAHTEKMIGQWKSMFLFSYFLTMMDFQCQNKNHVCSLQNTVGSLYFCLVIGRKDRKLGNLTLECVIFLSSSLNFQCFLVCCTLR